MQRHVLRAVLALALIHCALAHCPNFCNGHGHCTGQNKCDCFDHWMGGDCSLRRCPFGPAWTDVATATDTAHAEAECSNRGLCDHNTGVCDCMPGYEGAACGRMTCPNECNNHGTCRSMAFHASRKDPSTGEVFTYLHNWDAHLIFGCECDNGWSGFDCSERLCPTGDDCLTTGQANEIQIMRCVLDGVSADEHEFYLSFKGATTEAIAFDATPATVEAALEALPTIIDVDVTYVDEASGACSTTNLVVIEFLRDFGNLPDILSHAAGGYPARGNSDIVTQNTYWGYDGLDENGDPGSISSDNNLNAALSVKGTKENAPCSGRGDCNPDSGVCECYTGYTTSSGALAIGERGDCGFAQDPITACPGHLGVECSGHGHCSGFPAYECSCEEGWTNGDCNSRTCPTGHEWFALPTADDTAHFTTSECSNKGTCNRETGQCDCQDLFEGEACERMTCPGQTGHQVCSGHGQCLTMSGLAELNDVNGDLVPQTYGLIPNKKETWDYRSVWGCHCDEDWEGYDCSERSCMYGDDGTTVKEHPTGDLQTGEVQSYHCTYPVSGGVTTTDSFTITFRRHTTAPIQADATAAEVKAALELLESIETVEVTFPDPLTTVCSDAGTDMFITFVQPSGDVPDSVINRVTPTGSQLVFVGNTVLNNPVYPGANPTVDGTTEFDECSGRGLCDHSEGLCRCFDGFGASDGAGGRGMRPDCGYREPYVPVETNQPW